MALSCLINNQSNCDKARQVRISCLIIIKGIKPLLANIRGGSGWLKVGSKTKLNQMIYLSSLTDTTTELNTTTTWYDESCKGCRQKANSYTFPFCHCKNLGNDTFSSVRPTFVTKREGCQAARHIT